MFDLKNAAEKDRDFIEKTWKKLDEKLCVIAERSRDKIPYTSINGTHTDHAEKNICWWTNGFWGGLMWLMYYGTKKDVYKLSAERNEEILDKHLKAFTDFTTM